MASTALRATKRGIKAEIILKGTATVFPLKKVAKTHEKLKKAGINYI